MVNLVVGDHGEVTAGSIFSKTTGEEADQTQFAGMI